MGTVWLAVFPAVLAEATCFIAACTTVTGCDAWSFRLRSETVSIAV